MKKSIIIIALLLSSLTASAQSQSALPWMRIGRGAETQGMADAALVADQSVAWSSFTNSALIPFTARKLSAGLSYELWQADKTNYINAGFSYNIKDRFGVAFGVSYGMGKAYDVYGDNGFQQGTFTPSNFQINLGGSYRFLSFMSVGLNIRVAGQTLTSAVRSNTFAGDLMVMGQFSDFRCALGVVNTGTPVRDNAGVEFNIASSAKLDLGYSKHLAEKHGIGAYLDADYYFYGAFGAALGAQYAFNDMLFVRAGYRLGSKAVIPSYASLGLGFKFKGFHIDAAYLLANDVLANTICVGLGYEF